MSEVKYEVGDFVRVYFSNHPPMEGAILSSPCATGDSWVLKAKHSNGKVDAGDLVYIQQFDYMVRSQL